MDPAAFIALAAELGCSHVTLTLGPAANRLPPNPPLVLHDNPALQRAVSAALTDHRITLGVLEGLALSPEIAAETHAPALDCAARLGAKAVCAIGLHRDPARGHAEFAQLAQMAAARGLDLVTELGAGALRRIDKAQTALAAVDAPNFKLLIDTMHFFRFGGTLDQMAALAPGAIGHVQLCDAPMPAQIADYMTEALYERRAPGDGDLPLAEFLRLVPPGVVVGLEVPIRSEAEAGVPTRDRLARCVTAARGIMADAWGRAEN